jgi:serine/threonine protein kinase
MMTPDSELEAHRREWELDPGNKDLQRRYHTLLVRCPGIDSLPIFKSSQTPCPARMDHFLVHRILDRNASTQPLLVYNCQTHEMQILRFLSGAAFGREAGFDLNFFKQLNWHRLSELPNLLVPNDCFLKDSVVCYTVPYFYGQSLAAVIRRNELRWQQKLTILDAIASALEKVHQRKLLHQCLSADCVLIHDDEIRLFGFEKWDLELQRRSWATAVQATSAKIARSSPEQITGLKFDERSDIYQLGHIMYELLTGCQPYGEFQQQSTIQLVKAIAFESPKAPKIVNPALPEDASRICVKAMAIKPEHRYQSLTAFRVDLKRLMDGESILWPTKSWLLDRIHELMGF